MAQRKSFLAFTAALSLLGGLMSAQAPAQAADPVTINIASFGEVIQKDMIAAYKKLHPEVTINVSVSTMDGLAQQLTTWCLSRKTPDIVAIEISYSGYYRERSQCFQDLREMNPSASTIENRFLDWRWDQGVAFNGNVIGIPTDVGGNAIAYRVDLFKKAGLPTDRNKVSALWKTWDDFIEVGRKYKLKTKRAFMDNSGTLFNAVLNQGTAKYYRADGSLIHDTNPQVKTAFTVATKAMTTSFPAASKLPKDIGARIAPFTADWIAGMKKDAFAAMLAPAWMMDYIKKNAPSTRGKWDIATIPGGGGNWGGSQLTIPVFSPKKQAAWEFIRWYLAPAQQMKVFKNHGLFPSTKNLYNTPALTGYKDPFFNNAPVGQIYTKSALSLKPIVEGSKQRIIDQIFGQALSRVARGAQTPQAAWTQTMADINKSVG